MKDRIESQNGQIKGYINMFHEKDVRISELSEENSKVVYRVGMLEGNIEEISEELNESRHQSKLFEHYKNELYTENKKLNEEISK
jgi:hypothetical protein